VSWWADKLRAEVPEPPAPRYDNIAPGAWWQQTTRAATRPRPERPNTQHDTPAPDACPRCGGDNYAQFTLDPSFGGQGGNYKRCFDCRYPMFDASGDIVHGMRGGQPGKVTRQVGGGRAGSWQGAATFDNAVRIA